MKYAAKIEVSLKPGHSNPEGETTQRLLVELGYSCLLYTSDAADE